MHKWIIPAVLATFFLFCYAVGLLTIAGTVRTKIKALRVRWLYSKQLSINGAEPKQSHFFSA